MTGKKTVVAHVAGGLTTGGVESVIYEYVSHMDPQKYQWIYISYDTPDGEVRARFEALGFQVFAVTKKKEHFLKSCGEVYDILKKNQVQIVHSHMTLMCFVTNILGRMAGAEKVISHSHLVLYPRGLKRLVYEGFKWLSTVTATDWFACSRAAGAYLYGHRRMDRGQVVVMNNAIDYDRFCYRETIRSRMRLAWGLKHRQVIGHVGRFTEQKNHRFLLEIFAEYHRKEPDSFLLLVGDGPLKEEMETRAAAMGLKDAVLFAGACEQVQDWYMAMDVFVFPSIYEGLGIVALEAQLAGLPVLASMEVPREAALTEHMVFLPLEEGAEKWSALIRQMMGKRYTEDLRGILEDRHLEICAEAEKLDQFYRRT